ncbi:MAG: class I SAM-dependent DNA methyltransferase, partial [Candidatus Eremiobacteraeota bacterium]|nr:class I SAM-dependent DNA methyltransferase [Candidatus Eremiobacteraeota bacterium]
MDVQEFQTKWRGVTRTERSAAQEHFIDICRLLGQRTPAEADQAGEFYTFERGVRTVRGGNGFADVWWRGKFGWEYKRNRANLDDAYQQLLLYREDLENPPLLVVSDFERFQIHTNFTGTAKRVYSFLLNELDKPENLAALRAVFEDPERLRPNRTAQAVTEDVAARFGQLALNMQQRGIEPHRAAHFLVQLLFCFFAKDVGLLPPAILLRLLDFTAKRPERFPGEITALFREMQSGGAVAYEEIKRFNGGLFAEIDAVPLLKDELVELAKASRLDWGSIEPAIFGTLFERSLDPEKRAQLGAHYTNRPDIARVVDPLVRVPLMARWAAARAEAGALKAAWDVATGRAKEARRQAFANALFDFQASLAAFRVLDPACGSGNFLYVALAALKDVEKEVVKYGLMNGLPQVPQRVGPRQLHGLEINEYARELAQVVVWIGYLQWMHQNGFVANTDPVLEPLDTIRLQDALLDRADPAHPAEAAWPEADVIVGNPPFLGGKLLRRRLGSDYVDDLFAVYAGRVARESDFVCYFFERAREQIAAGRTAHAGLLATNSIRGGANRAVLRRIKESGDIFMAWANEPWILDGAAVRISIVGFDNGAETARTLDGAAVSRINPDLTAGVDITAARRLHANLGIAFMGDTKGGPFDVSPDLAVPWLHAPLNPNGRPNTDVVRPWVNGDDITGRTRGMFIVDFGTDMTETDAALYEAPFAYVSAFVKPERTQNRRAAYRERWWLHVEPRVGMRAALTRLARYIGTARVAKHRLFIWLPTEILPDSQVIVVARDDDYFFGVLHSRAHEVWSLKQGTWLGVGDDPRYTPTTCFETFPFPEPDDAGRAAIAEAAQRLDT